MNIAIVGSRSFTDYETFMWEISYFVTPEDHIISGGARGADSLAERFAEEFDIPITVYEADWDTHGKKAGIMRNIVIVKKSDIVIAFWDGNSRGTQDTIKRARQHNMPVIVIDI